MRSDPGLPLTTGEGEPFVTRTLTCCGGTTDGTTTDHRVGCPSVVRSALSWIEDTAHGERIRQRGLVAFDEIVGERDALREQLDAARQALETIADHSIVSERGPDEDCDWHCTAELVSLARAALGVVGGPPEKDSGSGQTPAAREEDS